jgi:hypothetical protein
MITTSSHAYSGYKLLSCLTTTSSSTRQSISRLSSFFSIYIWRDLTYLSLDTQRDYSTYIDSMHALIDSDARHVNAYADLLICDDIGSICEVCDDGMIPDMRDSVMDRMSISVLVFNVYLYEIDAAVDSVIKYISVRDERMKRVSEGNLDGDDIVKDDTNHTDKKHLYEQKLNGRIRDLENCLSKTTRFVKYALSLFETVSSKKQKRKELVYRCHFDFFYLGYLSFLFAMTDRCENTELSDIFKTTSASMSTFLLILIELTDCRDHNFSMLVKMRRQHFSVHCSSLAYRTAMDLMLINGKPIWELESYEVHKVWQMHNIRIRLYRIITIAISCKGPRSASLV